MMAQARMRAIMMPDDVAADFRLRFHRLSAAAFASC